MRLLLCITLLVFGTTQVDGGCVGGQYTCGFSCCDCDPGWYGSGAGFTCWECDPGKYSGRKQAECTNCAVGKYMQNKRASACTDCGRGKSSDGGATSCYDCPKGEYAPNEGSDCYYCSAGKYNDEVGQENCNNCPAGTYYEYTGLAYGAAFCTPCATGKVSAEGSDSSDDCQYCDFGQYKSSASGCSSCPDNAWAPQGSTTSTDCKCDYGATGPDGGPCTQCVAGEYKDARGVWLTGGVHVCKKCAAAKYSTTVASQAEYNCLGCPSNSNSPEGSAVLTSCTCNIGSSGPDGGDCVPCESGKYKDTTGTAVCVNCAAGKYSSSTSVCTACPPYSHSPEKSGTLESCICNAGYTGADGGTCTGCVAGKYKASTGSALCA